MEKTYKNRIEPNLEVIRDARKQGTAAAEICRLIGVSVPTFRKYLRLSRQGAEGYSELAKAFDGKETGLSEEQRVEMALYKACTGYTATVKKHYKVKNVEYDEITGKKTRETEEIVEADDEVHVPASIMAQKFYLMNRLPERWQVKLREDGAEDDMPGVIVIPEIEEDTEGAYENV